MDFVGCKTTFCHFGILPCSSVFSFERLLSLLLLPIASPVLHGAHRQFAKQNAKFKASNKWIEFGVARGTAA